VRLAAIGLIAFFAALNAAAAKADSCDGTPPVAVMTLPQPLSKWGTIVCTTYGHIISNHEGWIWSNPGSYSPVFIPAQMVKKDPAPLGNKSYFTKIDVQKVSGDEFQTAYQAYHNGFTADARLPDGYRLDVTSVSGRALRLYFFDYGTYVWGIWCPDGKCDTVSRFMILDMSHKPQ
jgi:hypothetical protein